MNRISFRNLCVIFFLSGIWMPGISIAQNPGWFEVGAKGSLASTWLYNGNVFNDNAVAYDFSFGNTKGIKITYAFNESFSLNIEGLHSVMNQRYQSNTPGPTWTKTDHLTTIDIPLLFRQVKNASYIEIGPVYSRLLGASQTYSSSPSSNLDYNFPSAKDRFESVNFAAVFGFGSNLISLGENAYVTSGFRFSYGLNDILSVAGGKGEAYPYTTFPTYPSGSSSKAYKPTRPFSVALVLEINYNVGYVAQAKCSRRAFLFF